MHQLLAWFLLQDVRTVDVIRRPEGATMKKLLASAMMACLIGAGVFAQEPSAKAGGTDPQFALSILSEYFEKDERGDRVGGAVLTSIGGVLLAGGIAGALYSITPPVEGGMYEDANGQMLVRGLSIGVSGTGLILGGIGISLLAKPDDAYKREYAYLYAETDPVIQEAIAYGVMKELADEARRGRIVSGLINITTPLAMAGGYAIAAAATDSWDEFDDNVLGALSWSLPSLVSGIITLVSGKSVEERMLDSYTAMSASFASSGKR
jgi:MFS family permease